MTSPKDYLTDREKKVDEFWAESEGERGIPLYKERNRRMNTYLDSKKKDIFPNMIQKDARKKYKPKYFHDIVCFICGNTHLTCGFNIRNKKGLIEIDCPKCNEPVMGIEIPKEKIQMMIGFELLVEKIK